MIRKNLKTKVILAAGLLWVGGLGAQTSINSSGGDSNNSSGSVSFSMGQVFHSTESNSSGSVEEGVQHAYVIETSDLGTQIKEISLKVYPNPTEDYLILKVNEKLNQDLKYNLFNVQGEEITYGNVDSDEVQINMNGLTPGTYFLNVLDAKNLKIKNFKIIKK